MQAIADAYKLEIQVIQATLNEFVRPTSLSPHALEAPSRVDTRIALGFYAEIHYVSIEEVVDGDEEAGARQDAAMQEHQKTSDAALSCDGGGATARAREGKRRGRVGTGAKVGVVNK